ncbi:MAG TPA: alpha-1,4-glucan--maltose-1-phosphate maltosyltransferase [Nocardioidaceae bacterium]|nr:alpha-1,4-glucan--maltose-1-phosphate maltosyltransferase [Nocardioidaceae bacterium]
MIGRIPVLSVTPVVEGGRYPAKAAVGEPFEVTALVFREGHDALGAGVVLVGPDGVRRDLVQMTQHEELDRYTATVACDAEGPWQFVVEAWSDPVATWVHNAEIKVPAGIDVELMLEEGARLMERAKLKDAAKALRDASRPPEVRLAAGTTAGAQLRDLITSEGPFSVYVDRERALYGAWYELFPRSEGASLDGDVVVTGTFKTAAERLPAVKAMGFDVVYLPPIHPIGEVNRKGPNNTLTPGPDDVGSPWAIGSAQGGHDAVHPDLGTIEDFDAFVARATEEGLEVALDLALQAAPDHPWVSTHPEWFTTLADGTIAYAENPPKKYQDIYPVNFDNDPPGIYAEVLRVARHWMDHGVRIFRVDNPHTKPVQFWEWLLAEVRATDPDVIFLSEAFTKPTMMHMLGKIGFHQSYTYFTWRNDKPGIEEYMRELSTYSAPFLRPNFFVNTPDILHEYLQYGGPAAFKIRATLAAMASPSWGVYAGFELFEHVAAKPGSEEYLDSEKYQLRIRDWDAEGSLAPYIGLLNQLRKEHPALRLLRNYRQHATDDAMITCFSKSHGDDHVIVVLNLDPHAARETTVHLNMPALGLDWADRFVVRDEVSGEEWTWGESNYVRLDPHHEPAHILTIRKAG